MECVQRLDGPHTECFFFYIILFKSPSVKHFALLYYHCAEAFCWLSKENLLVGHFDVDNVNMCDDEVNVDFRQ